MTASDWLQIVQQFNDVDCGEMPLSKVRDYTSFGYAGMTFDEFYQSLGYTREDMLVGAFEHIKIMHQTTFDIIKIESITRPLTMAVDVLEGSDTFIKARLHDLRAELHDAQISGDAEAIKEIKEHIISLTQIRQDIATKTKQEP